MATSTAPPNAGRTGTSYLDGLADGRRVYLAGRPVADLAHDPSTEGMAAFLAELLDEHRPDGELTDPTGTPSPTPWPTRATRCARGAGPSPGSPGSAAD